MTGNKPVLRNPFKESYLAGVLMVMVASAVMYLLEWRNHGINLDDFEVYYRSAERLLGGENLYRIESDGYYIFKYSPASALFFIPFTLFSLGVAKNLYWIFLTGVAIIALSLSIDIASTGKSKPSPARYNLLLIFLLLSLGLHLYREFSLGQVNMVLFSSYLLVVWFIHQKKFIPAAILLAIGIAFKPWGLIFIPYFFLKKDFRAILYFMIFGLALMVFPVVFYGYEMMVEQTGKWIHEMQVELSYKQELGAMSNHTIFSIFYRYTPLRFIETSRPFDLVYQSVVLILLGLATFAFIRKGIGTENKEVAEGALLMGLMPLLAPANYNTFLLAGLAIAILLVHFRELPSWGKLLLVAGILLQGGNYNDIWGLEFSNYLLALSIVSIGVVILLAMLFLLRFRKKV